MLQEQEARKVIASREREPWASVRCGVCGRSPMPVIEKGGTVQISPCFPGLGYLRA